MGVLRKVDPLLYGQGQPFHGSDSFERHARVLHTLVWFMGWGDACSPWSHRSMGAKTPQALCWFALVPLWKPTPNWGPNKWRFPFCVPFKCAHTGYSQERPKADFFPGADFSCFGRMRSPRPRRSSPRTRRQVCCFSTQKLLLVSPNGSNIWIPSKNNTPPHEQHDAEPPAGSELGESVVPHGRSPGVTGDRPRPFGFTQNLILDSYEGNDEGQ